MGVAEDFQNFQGRYLISATTLSSITYRYKRITRQLNQEFWGSDSDVSHSLYVGSYGRDTAAKGVSDLDVAFVLPGHMYTTYNNYTGNGQSALLQAVKRAIQKTYPTSESFGDGQVVIINFNDDITFEVLPVFENSAGTWNYPDANGGGSWRTSNPRAEIQAIRNRNLATNRNLKAICRMARIWKNHCNVFMSGILIDTLAYQFIDIWQHRDKSYLYHDLLVRDFMGYVSRQDGNQGWLRAPGSGSYVINSNFYQAKARSAYHRAVEAISHENSGQRWSATQKWREIFGPLYG